MTVSRTLPDHSGCARHSNYKLNCAQFEDLLAESGQRCQLCGTPGRETPLGKLCIDHAGPWWKVRGLLCGRCNVTLGTHRQFPPGPQCDYLASAWWKRQCATAGLPEGLRAEPPVGAAIRNQWGWIWIHSSDWRWNAPNRNGCGLPTRSWERLYHSYGAHNLVPFDLGHAVADPAMSSLRLELERGSFWAEVREVIDLPEVAVIPRHERLRLAKLAGSA